jgi:D-sedoheptulose 7-phosphate isomerase
MDSSVISNSLQEAQKALSSFIDKSENIEKIQNAAETFAAALKSNKRIISCGNGGSMCDASHFAEELTGRFKEDRQPLPATAISDPAHISCTANDFGYEYIFSRFVEAWGNQADCLLGISTSGNSPNIIKAVEAAKAKKMKTIALLGKDGGKLKDLVDIAIVVENQSTARIQEIHIKVIHILIESIEKILFG